jgi:hypothetical protein
MKIDLHMHTNCSDGTDDWKTVLQKCEELGLKTISITDHNNVDAYFQIKNPEKYFSGKIIRGIEPACMYMGRCIELLGYGIDVNKMRELLEGIYMPRTEINKIQYERFYKKLVQGGVKFDEGVFENWDREKYYYGGCYLLSEIKKHPENKKIITDEDSWNNSIQFYRNHGAKKSSPFYVNEEDLLPSASTIYNFIKQAGGLVFIAHPLLYGEDSVPILESLVKEFQIDGVECFYGNSAKAESGDGLSLMPNSAKRYCSSHTPEQTQYLLDFCTKHNLLVSGGSDYHGHSRPHVKLGVADERAEGLVKWTEWLK